MTTKMAKNEYPNVLNCFKEALGDESFGELEKRINSRRLVKTLINMRVSKGLTQSQLANQAGVSQPQISRLENGEDCSLQISDIEMYAKAASSEVTILISEGGSTLADQIKYHAFSIRKAFLRLAELSHTDELIAKGVADLHIQAFVHLNQFLMETAEKLPKQPSNGEPYIKIAAGNVGNLNRKLQRKADKSRNASPAMSCENDKEDSECLNADGVLCLD